MKLYIDAPTVAFAARVNQALFVYPLAEVQFDTVTTGTFSSVVPNMTVYFGTAPGLSDLGVSRVRKLADSDTLFFGRSSQGAFYGQVNLADNCYITVLNDYRVWPKMSYIDPDGVIFMDSDLDWATYGRYSAPVANCGSAYVGLINPGTGLITVQFTSANSFTTHPGATIASRGWAVYDGTITVGTSASTAITATFPAGFRWVTLGIIDSNGMSHYSHVPVLAINPASDPCVPNFVIERQVIQPAGQALSIRVRSALPASTYPDNTLCLLFDGYAASSSDRSNVEFVGWLESEATMMQEETTGLLRDVVLECVDVAGRLKLLPGFPLVLEHKDAPAEWGQMDEPDINRFIHYILSNMSTALDLADFSWAEDGEDYLFTGLFSEGTTLFAQIAGRARAMIPDHQLTCSRRGVLRVLPYQLILPTGDRTVTVQATLTDATYRDIDYVRQRAPRVHWLRSDAFLVSSTETETLYSIAPGLTPGFGASASEDRNHLARSQDDLNIVTGHRFALLNAPESAYRITLIGSSDLDLEPADLTWVNLTLPASYAAQRGLTFTAARGLVQEIDIRHSQDRTGNTRTVTLQWEREALGIPAVIEPVATAEPVDDGGFNVPPNIPSGFNNGLIGVGGNVVGFIDRGGIIYKCSDFTTATPPTWSRNTSAAAAASIGANNLRTFIIDPFSPGYRGLGSEIRGFAVSGTIIYRVNDLFGSPSYTALHTLTTSATNAAEWCQIAASFGRYEAVEANNPWIMVAYSAATGSNPLRTYVVYSRDGGATWSSEIDVSTFTRTQVTQEISAPAIYMSPRTPGLAYVGAWKSPSGATPSGALYVTTDWGATWSLATAIDGNLGHGLGWVLHVPWQGNSGESVAYFDHFDRTGSTFKYRLYRSVSGAASDISPLDSGKRYGPARNQFGVRALDSDRNHVILAGVHDDVDNVAIGSAGTDAYSAIWMSHDGGTTWSRLSSDAITTGDCVLQVAFSPDDEDVFYGWGNSGYLVYCANGSTIVDKSPVSPIATTSEIMAIFGGPL